jgi:hypothetical protein
LTASTLDRRFVVTDRLDDLHTSEYDRLRKLSDEKILKELGGAILASEPSSLRARPADLVGLARQWIAAERGRLQQAICANISLRKLAEAEPTARLKMARLIIDTISALYFYLPAATLAEILLRDGIKDLCSSQWHDAEV